MTIVDKKVVKYMDINGNEFEAHNTLVVYRKMKSKKCKCHHMRISGDTGLCTYHKCRHDTSCHPIFPELFNF